MLKMDRLLSKLAFSLLFCSSVLLLPGAAFAQVRMTELDEVAQTVTLKNFGGSAVDTSGYYMCREPGTYQIFTALTIVGAGDLNLDADEEVTLVYGEILSSGTGIGVYLNANSFNNAANMADYMQYLGVAGFRESVAVTAGLWATGEFATGDPGPFFYTGDGDENGAAFWTNSPPKPPNQTPALSTWGIGGLCAVLVGSYAALRRRRVA
jgi:hypothetical protein